MQGTPFSYKSQMLIVLACLCCLGSYCQQAGVMVAANGTGLQVTVSQQINFGAFTQGVSGGSITITAAGARLANGSVVPLNFGSNHLPLMLEIVGPKGSIVSMLADETSTLTGSNGGTMKLKLRNSYPTMPFVIMEDAPAKNILRIGAELIVGNATESPPGNYSGALNISFVAE